MTNSKNTKRALLTSAISLLLCVAMLVGSTFAWFTDSVTSGQNKIVAGNLDVELYHTNAFVEKATSVDKAADLFVDAKGQPIKWEPGVVAYEDFTVKNEGTLALKYELAITTDAANHVVTADGTATERTLADVLKIALVETAAYASRDAMIEAVKDDMIPLKDYVSAETVKSGKLLPEDATAPAGEEGWNSVEEAFTVVLYWEPGADDDLYNLKNGAYADDVKDEDAKPGALSIDLSVNLDAAQVPFEFDSFDKNYDNKPFLKAEKKAARIKEDEEKAAAGYPFRIGDGDEVEYFQSKEGGRQVSILERLPADGTPGVLTSDYNFDSIGTEGYKGIEGIGKDNGIYCLDLNGHTATANWILMKAQNLYGSGFDFELRNGVMNSFYSHYCDVDVYGAKNVLLDNLTLGTFKNGDWVDKDDNYADPGKDTWAPSGNYTGAGPQIYGYCSPIKIFMNETAEGSITIKNVKTYGGANRIKPFNSTVLIDGCVFTGSVGPVYKNGTKKADPEALYITGQGGSHEVAIKNTTVTNKQVRLEDAGVVNITGSVLSAGLNVEGNTSVTLTDCTVTNDTNTTGRTTYKDLTVSGDGRVTIVSGKYSFDPEKYLAKDSKAVKDGDYWVVTAG